MRPNLDTDHDPIEHFLALGMKAVDRRYYDRFARGVVSAAIRHLRAINAQEDATFLRGVMAHALNHDRLTYRSGGYLSKKGQIR